MFGWEFPPHISGGLGTACYGLTKGLANQDVDVLFVMPRANGDEDQSIVRIVNASDVEMGFDVSGFEAFWKRINFVEIASNLIPYVSPEEYEKRITGNVKNGGRNTYASFRNKYKFSGSYSSNLMEEVAHYALVGASVAAQNTFDVIHAHDWLTYPAGVAAKKISGKPLVVHVHATEFDRSGENINQLVYDIEQTGMMAADCVITVSHLTRSIVINKYGIDPDKVITVHNAVAFDRYSSVNEQRGVSEKVVTFLGRVTFQKGPEYFIEAAAKVLKNFRNVRFVMAGSGDMLHRSIRRVAKLGMATHFHFTGFLQGADVQRMFAHSDVYVMPSVSEPFGISPLEAMRSKVPTIISKQSGVAEVLKYAIKVDFWDVNALADAIYGLLAYPALSKMAVRCGLDEVNALKWDNAAQKVKNVYEAVIQKNE
jgi:glycosyltransferase involved in cell wall biosynthesis